MQKATPTAGQLLDIERLPHHLRRKISLTKHHHHITATILNHKMTLTVPFFLLLVATIAGALETASLTSKSSISLTSQHFTEASPTGEFETTSYDTIAGVTNGHVTIPAKTIAISFPTCIQTITPDKNGYLPPGTCNALWDYYPSFVTAVAFSVLFGALTTIHIGQAVKYRKVRIDPCLE
jgi:hypothetical protein